jgi:hypothetical protein
MPLCRQGRAPVSGLTQFPDKRHYVVVTDKRDVLGDREVEPAQRRKGADSGVSFTAKVALGGCGSFISASVPES